MMTHTPTDLVSEQMNEPYNRLMKARRVAGYRSARAAASVLRVKPATYAAHENGTRTFSVGDAIRYAELYNVSPGWILTGEHFHDDKYTKISDTSLTEPVVRKNPQSSEEPRSEEPQKSSEAMSQSAIYNFGKQALELLGRIEPAAETEPSQDTANQNTAIVGEVIIHRLLDGDFDHDSEQWEIVTQWRFPPDFVTDVLGVSPLDVALLSMPHDNMSPTYAVGDRLIIDFKQKSITIDGVYIFMDEARKMHIQRLKRHEKQVIISNDNPAENSKHPAKTIAKNHIEIVGRICGVIAAR